MSEISISLSSITYQSSIYHLSQNNLDKRFGTRIMNIAVILNVRTTHVILDFFRPIYDSWSTSFYQIFRTEEDIDPKVVDSEVYRLLKEFQEDSSLEEFTYPSPVFFKVIGGRLRI